MKNYKAALVPGGYYHIYNRAVGSEQLFLNDNNYDYFLFLFSKYILPIAHVFGYCLLPNHFHFFIRIKKEEDLIERMKEIKYRKMEQKDRFPQFCLQQFSNFFNAYTKSFNKVYDRKGKLFIESFRRKAIRSPSYYTKLVHYIHTNPVHHGYCNGAEEWEFSSYHQFTRNNGWLNTKEVIRWFGSLEAFYKFHKQPIRRKFKIAWYS